jgi:rhodanese-related sulfurtransferase
MTHGLFATLYGTNAPFALIDSREWRDYVNGHWFGSINMPLSRLTTTITRLIPDRSFPIHFLDWQNKASAVAIERLNSLGYSHVTIHPTAPAVRFGRGFVKGEYVWSKAFGEVVAHTADLPEVTPAEYIESWQDALLFDVRPTAEYQLFTLPNSQSLPNSLLLANADALRSSGKMALLHCAGRTRSIIGACTLKAAGYDGPYAVFRGGTQAWQLDGHTREHNAARLFATDHEDSATVERFMQRWHISFSRQTIANLADFVAANATALRFDVSDDAATGQVMEQGIIKISGTNLIQQTDRSIARYHVPVILFDQGSGSRAAFAAYWLGAMGFDVSVVYLDAPLAAAPTKQSDAPSSPIQCQATELQADQVLPIYDLRPSAAFRGGHITGSLWKNISELADMTPDVSAIRLICSDFATGIESTDILTRQGWQIDGFYVWQDSDFDPATLKTGGPDSPCDESSLFAGRHHGVLQDARDYLAWEEDLPAEIDQPLHQLWFDRLTSAPAS